MIARARSFWQDRTTRERGLLGLLGVVVAAGLANSLVWQPLAVRRSALVDAITVHAAAEQYLMQGGVVSAAPAASSDPGADQPLAVRLTGSAAALGLTVRRLDPVGAGALDVALEEAPFDAVMAWLVELERDRGLDLRSFSIQRRPAPGMVSATISIGE